MNEKAYKTMTNTGAGSLVLGIILLVTGLAAGVLMMASAGRCRADRSALMTPFFSSSVCHASVRRRKFIHMGRMKINTTKLPRPMCRLRRMSASG